MNKIYKVIWSKAKHCYVVVSELAKNHTKGCGRRSLRRTAVSLGIVATLLGGFSGSAWADGSGTIAADEIGVITAGDNINISASTDTGTTTITISATDTNTTYTAGKGLQLTGTEFSVIADGDSITVGTNGIKVSDTLISTINSKANASTTYTKTEVDTALGAKADASTTYTKTEVDTVLGAKADAATTYTKTEVDTALGAKANKDGSNVTTPATWATALGTGAIKGTGQDHADELVTGSTVYNYLNTRAKLDLGEYSKTIQIGQGSSADTQTIAIGENANTTYSSSIAIGDHTTASHSTAIGSYAKAEGYYAIAIGGDAAKAKGSHPIAIGSEAKATWNNAVALGHGAEASIMVDDPNNSGSQIPGDTESATALGAFSKAQSNYATAVGASAEASNTSSTALGYQAKATYPNTTALGAGAQATANNSIAIGTGTSTDNYSKIIHTTASGESSIAIGNSAEAKSSHTIAMGPDAIAEGSAGTIAIGYNAHASGNNQATALGGSATAWQGTAVGYAANANGVGATALGESAQAAEYATTLGTYANASENSSVALGYSSVANRAAYAGTTNTAYLGDDNDPKKRTPAWKSTHGAVSVGDDTSATKVTRQITGVAAGTLDTDAVNVAQLKSATPMINSAHNYYVGTTTAGVKVTDAVDAVDAALGKVAAGNYITAYVAATTTTEATGTFAENLSLLDAQAKTNADNIGTLQTKTQNITATAGTTIMEGVLNVVPTGETTGIAINGTDKTITGLSNKTWDATNITSGRAATEDQLKLAASSLSTTLTDTGLQFGANLNTATNNDTVVTNKLGSQVKVLGGGAQSGHTYSAANVTTEITQEAGNSTIIIKLDHNPTFGNISGASLAVSGMLSSASLKVNNIDVTTPLTTPGAVASDNPGFVIGGTVYSEVRPTADGIYVKTANTTAANLTALDTQVKTNAENITALQSSTTAAVGTLTEDGNYIKKSSTNNIVQNLSALDTQVKKNTDDIATLQNSISVQEDASGTKTTTIEGNLVIKDKDGTTKDVTTALSTDGEVAKKGDAGSEGFLKGETVYDYLNKGDNGKEVKLATESQQISIGKGSEASGAESIAIGNEVGTQKNQATGTQSIAIGFGNQVTGDHSGAIGDPNTLTGTDSYVIGNNNTIGGNNTFVLGNNVTANVDNAVVLGNNSTAEANAVSVGSVGGERQIKHVAPGTDANDAATFGQLSALAQAADNSIGRLDSKVNKVGAGAAALAALHPIDTDDKFTMGLGYGNYRDAHSAAIGLFYRPTEKIMISMGGTLGNGENMINAGISFALDKGKGFGTSKAMLARKIAAQEEKITQQDAKIQSLEEENAKLAARLAAIEEKLEK